MQHLVIYSYGGTVFHERFMSEVHAQAAAKELVRDGFKIISMSVSVN